MMVPCAGGVASGGVRQAEQPHCNQPACPPDVPACTVLALKPGRVKAAAATEQVHWAEPAVCGGDAALVQRPRDGDQCRG
jgi:hypothetical protein